MTMPPKTKRSMAKGPAGSSGEATTRRKVVGELQEREDFTSDEDDDNRPLSENNREVKESGIDAMGSASEDANHLAKVVKTLSTALHANENTTANTAGATEREASTQESAVVVQETLEDIGQSQDAQEEEAYNVSFSLFIVCACACACLIVVLLAVGVEKCREHRPKFDEFRQHFDEIQQ